VARAEKIAARMTDTILTKQPMVTKSAGTRAPAWSRQQIEELVYPAAILIAEVEKSIRRRGKLLKAMDRQAQQVAALAAQQVPGVTDIQQGLVDLDLQRFGVGLVDRQKAPKSANGHGAGHGDAPPPEGPPSWHPEHFI
jgi:hypothetical protein